MAPESINWALTCLVLSATILVYSVHRSKNYQSIGVEPPTRYLWHLHYQPAYYFTLAGSAVLLLYSLFSLPSILIYCLLPLGILSIAYSYPIFPFWPQIFPLKRIPYLKIFLIAFAFSSVTVLLPIISAKGLLSIASSDVLLFFGERMLFILAITLPFDIRDLDQDITEGVKTIPALIGVRKTVVLSAVLLLGHTILVTIHAYAGLSLSIWEGAALVFAALISGVIVCGVTIKRGTWYYAVLVDGTMIIQSTLVFFAYSIKGA
jgi:4-hydroxybenzoate polyprenyltransferase